MGLLKAMTDAIGGTLADQWKEFFYCEAMDMDTLMVKGQKKIGNRSSNKKGSDNIITNGSGIVVADGQCMMIVDQGRIVEICAEPGEFTYDTSSEPSVFSGDLGDGIEMALKTIWDRVKYGGEAGKDQRVYYFNMKELMDNKFGTPNPIPFRVVDRNIGLDVDVSVRCSGVYSYKITNPVLFYTNVCGNVKERFDRDEIEKQLKTEFISALQPAFGQLSRMEIRPSAIPGHAQEMADAMNEALTKKWSELRGLSVVSVAINSITLPQEDAEMIKAAQKTGMMRDPNMAAATLVGAQADAMKAAAANSGGAMTGFMGMGMAQQAGGVNAQNLFQMGANIPKPMPQSAPVSQGWVCECGASNTGKFCSNCGAKKPEENVWTCSCGAVNRGKFCSECGSPRPESEWTCTCGSINKGKFCSNCGAARP